MELAHDVNHIAILVLILHQQTQGYLKNVIIYLNYKY